jgi:hypothetical protein
MPAWFEGTIFDTYPYLLPNLVCTVIVVCGLTIGVLFLEETHEDRKYDQDRGRDAGQWLLSKVWKQAAYAPLSDKDVPVDEMRSMLDSHAPRTYRSAESSPTLCSSRSSLSEPPPYVLEKDVTPAPKIRNAFTKQVCLNILCYGILAL